ncbi:MAG: S-layer homology domain-containing protein [Sedimentibacter sp.]
MLKSPYVFSDVKADAGYANAVSIAKAAGYITGYPDGTMRPENPISREEVASIIMEIKTLTPDDVATDIFTDVAQMTWSKGAIGATATQYNLALTGDNITSNVTGTLGLVGEALGVKIYQIIITGATSKDVTQVLVNGITKAFEIIDGEVRFICRIY